MEGWGWQSVHDPAELPRVLAAWQASIRTGAPFEMVFPLRGADDIFRPFLTRVVPSVGPSGAVTAWYGVNTDISEQTIAERELADRRIAEAQLLAAKAAAEEARLQAEVARGEAERASAAKSDFLASMSHEIRTPLNAIIGYTDLLIEEHRGAPSLSRRLELIRRSGDGLLAIVNDVLDFSKVEAGQIELEAIAFSPRTLIDNVVSMLGAFAARKGIRLDQRVEAEVPAFLLGDESRLRQIVLNLANNAVKFTSEGTVLVTVTADRVTDAEADIRITVKDSGIGISQEQQARLFQRFSQIDSSITRRFGGSGLGLAICKQLVELMGGAIGVTSREGEGATFWCTVPLRIATPDAVLPPSDADLDHDRVKGAWILLVEDVAINQELAMAVLERLGHRVDLASDGMQAIAKIRDTAYDLVLMDVQMPVMDGVTATRIIRGADHGNARVPIVAMTANVMPQQIAALLEAGMDDHVGKPFRFADLEAVVQRWRFGHDARRTQVA